MSLHLSDHLGLCVTVPTGSHLAGREEGIHLGGRKKSTLVEGRGLGEEEKK